MKTTKRRLYTQTLLLVLALWSAGHNAFALAVKEVKKDGQLMLEDDSMVRLAGVVFPVWNDAVAQATRELALAKDWQVDVRWRDRHDMPHAVLRHAKAGALQAQLLRAGVAMAYAPEPLKELNAWQAMDACWRVDQRQAGKWIGHYRAVQGVVRQVAVKRNMAFINFGEDWQTDFTVFVPPETLRVMDRAALTSLQGKKIVVRGLIEAYDGARITLLNPQMMQPDATNPHSPSCLY